MSRGYNPFNKWKLPFRVIDAAPSNRGGGNLTPANHKVTGADQLHKGSLRIARGDEVNLPRTNFAPPSSQTVDISFQASIPALTLTPLEVMSYTAPQQSMVQIMKYAINTTAPGLTFFFPTVNGHRVYPQIGLPDSDFLITFPTGPDLGNNSLIDAPLPLKPGDIFRWLVINADVAAHTMAIRSTGFTMSNQAYEDTRFGG